jgi:hypothetical protein
LTGFRRNPLARVPDSELERLKAEVSVQRLAEARGVVLKKHGADLMGLCPFHDDKKPSLVRSSPVSSNALVASRRLRFNPLAEEELQDAASWYHERVAGLGGRFITAIRHRASEIVESPRRWPLIRGARRVLDLAMSNIPGSPYELIQVNRTLASLMALHP